MKRKVQVTIIIVFLIFITYLFLCLQETKNVVKTLDGFYEDFINEDYPNTHNYFDIKFRTDLSEIEKQGRIVQQLINDRHWYGDIKSVRYMPILWLGSATRFVFVTVEYGTDQTGTDHIRLKKIKNEWVIKKYSSGSDVNLP